MDHDMNGTRSRPVPLTTGGIAISEDVDMEPTGSNTLHNDDNDSLPDLMELSESSSESGSVQSSADVLEVMQAVDGGQNTSSLSTSHNPSPATSPPPTLPAFQPFTRSNNRRPRVEDDEDEERDRRHPSQRTPSSEPAQPQQPPPRPNTRVRTTLNLPSLARMGLDQADPLRFFQHLMPQQPQTQQSGANDTPTAGNNNPTAAPQPNRLASSAAPTPQVPQNQPHGGFSMIVLPPWFRLLPPPRIITHPGNAHATIPGNDNGPEPETMALFTEILMRLGALGALLGGSMAEPESEDPERAKKLIDGLEEVPIGLVRRLARVGGTDDPDGGRDTMCAICWDQLLDEAGFGKYPATDDVSSAQSDTSSSQMTESSIPEEQPEESKQPKIVVLPCAHVFHADCLIPWFSRPKQTTCPSCRFNIDPENLTRTRRSRRPAPMRPAQPNAAADATHGAQQPAQDANPPSQPTNGNTDNTNPQPTGNIDPNNGLGGHFVFDTLQVPMVLAAPPIISVNLDGLPNNGNGDPADGMQGIPNDIMEQIRARMEERLNDMAGQGSQQPSHDTNSATTNTSPPTQPATPIGSPTPPLVSGPQPQSDNDHGTTHSIIFGFDVLVGGPRPEGNMTGVDGGARNGTGRDGDQNWFSMMMRDLERNQNDAPAADTGTPATNNNDPGRNNAGRERPAAGQSQNGTGAPGQGQGFPRFLDMNFGNGDSVHIASGMGRTVGEAMAQLLSSMTNSDNQGPANTDTAAETSGNVAHNDNTNPRAAESSTNGPADGNRQGQTQNQQNQEGGMFASMTSFPFQMMSQMFGLGAPIRVNQRQNQGHDQSSTNPDTSAASQASQPGDNTRIPNNAPPAEQGGGGGASQPNNSDNAADGDEGPFTRFMRNMMAANAPMPDDATRGQTAHGATPPPPHFHFFPPGFAMRTDPPSSTPSNAQQPQKQQWTPPPAPGPTLRERIEKREREVGLRCCDMSCGVGPSDEDPLIVLTTEGMKQLALKPVNFDGTKCPHTFHPACLVSAERVALRGADAPIVGDDVEVSCSVCRALGRVSKTDWEEGVHQLT